MGQAFTGVVIDDAALTLEELAQACAVQRDWVVQHVSNGGGYGLGLIYAKSMFNASEGH